MSEDEEFYLDVEATAFATVAESSLMALIVADPYEGFLYLFDSAYAMGFGACQKMLTEGRDVHQFNMETLSLLERKGGNN